MWLIDWQSHPDKGLWSQTAALKRRTTLAKLVKRILMLLTRNPRTWVCYAPPLH